MTKSATFTVHNFRILDQRFPYTSHWDNANYLEKSGFVLTMPHLSEIIQTYPYETQYDIYTGRGGREKASMEILVCSNEDEIELTEYC